MNNKLKTILKYIGVASIGAIVGIGALIGVSKCSTSAQPRVVDHVEMSIKPKRASDILIGNQNILDGTYRYFPKSYSTWRNSTFLVPSASVENIKTESDWTSSFLWLDDNRFPYEQGNSELSFAPEFQTAYVQGQYTAIYLSKLDIHISYLNPTGNQQADTVITVYDLSDNDPQQVYDDNKELMSTIYGGVVNGNELSTPSFYEFFDYVKIGDGTHTIFSFAKDWNFNAFAQLNYNQDASQPVSAQYKYPVSSMITGSGSRELYFDTPWFISNGMLFNQIHCSYRAAYPDSIYIKDETGQFRTYPTDVMNSNYTYFYTMEYCNTIAQYEKLVCQRASYSSGGDTYYDYEPVWINDGYRELEFLDELDTRSSLYAVLSLANTYSTGVVNSGFNNQITGDVGLSSVFTLIGSAFSSLVPILSISIVPGITIGLLLFLPLITGIIILIIWLVKR